MSENVLVVVEKFRDIWENSSCILVFIFHSHLIKKTNKQSNKQTNKKKLSSIRVAFEGGFVEDSWAIALINTKFRHCKCRDILVYNETWVKSIQIDTERSVRVLTSAKHNDPCENKLPERYTSLHCFVLLYLTTRTILIVFLLQQTLSILFSHSQSSQKDVSARYATTSISYKTWSL